MDSILTQLLAEEWATKPAKPTAMGTPLRYSGAHGCSRQMGYFAFGATPTDPMDEGDSWAPGIGTLLHESAQYAIGRLYTTAQFEVVSTLGNYLSGATDALVETQEIQAVTGESLGGTHVLWELKTMGEWAFDKQVGFNRRANKIDRGIGPKPEAIAQAGMNALGIESGDSTIRIETLLMGSLCVSTMSVAKAKAMGVSGFARFGAEFRIPREQWEPAALEELGRMELIGEQLAQGVLPDREAIGDGEPVFLNPRGKDWRCDYCQFRSVCVADGEGAVKASDSWMTK